MNTGKIISVRPMREDDLEWVINLGENTPEFKTETEAAQFFASETLRNWVNDPNGVTLVAEIDGQKAGFLLGCYITGPNDGYINCTVIESKHRRKGAGRELQVKALEEFSQKGPERHKCNHVWSFIKEDEEPMLNLKKELGFEIGTKGHYVEIMLPQKGKEF